MGLTSGTGLFQHVLIYIVDLHLVLPALNLSTPDAGLLTELGGLLHVLPLAVHPNFYLKTSRGGHSEKVLLLGICCGTLSSCSKVYSGWVGDWVGGVGGVPHDFSVSPSPLGTNCQAQAQVRLFLCLSQAL